MAKASTGSLPRGRRTRAETPPVPDRASLPPFAQRPQEILEDLVTRVGGRFATGRPGPSHVDELADYFVAFADQYAEEVDGVVVYHGQPGFWRALDDLYPLQDPNRWDPLRAAVILELRDRGWRRINEPRGSAWVVPTPRSDLQDRR